jgi:hypothetical protein
MDKMCQYELNGTESWWYNITRKWLRRTNISPDKDINKIVAKFMSREVYIIECLLLDFLVVSEKFRKRQGQD